MPPRKAAPASDKPYSDFIQPFLIDHSLIRGRLVRLNKALDNILGAHNYPLPVSLHLAEQIVLTALLSATLSGDDILTVQAKGEGPVRFMVVDAMAGGAIRGYAEVDEEALKKTIGKSNPAGLTKIMGKGYLAVTLDSGREKRRYQGIVELTGDSLSEALKAYFLQSQQAEMQVHVAIRPPEAKAPDKKNEGWRAGGIIIERMPNEGGRQGDSTPEEQDDLWLRSGYFMQTLKDAEMLNANVTPQNLLYRLFSEDGVWVYKLQPLKSGCRCSRERVSAVLKSLPQEELLDALEDDKLTIHCQFCNKREVFTGAQVRRLYRKPRTRKKAK
jgi:molecular chaperone Hsp33